MALPDPEKALADSRAKPEEDEKKPARLAPSTVIEIDVVDAWGDRTKGLFAYTVPTIGSQIEVGKLKALYLPDGASADVNAAMVVDMICYLTVCIEFTDAFPRPKWWAPLKARDASPYTALYGRCLAYEARFHGAGEDHGRDEVELRGEDRPSGDAEVRVGSSVQPAPKRSETLAGDGAGST